MQVTQVSGSIAESMAVTAEALNAGKKNIEQLVSQVSVTEQTNSQVAAELTSLKSIWIKCIPSLRLSIILLQKPVCFH